MRFPENSGIKVRHYPLGPPCRGSPSPVRCTCASTARAAAPRSRRETLPPTSIGQDHTRPGSDPCLPPPIARAGGEWGVRGAPLSRRRLLQPSPVRGSTGAMRDSRRMAGNLSPHGWRSRGQAQSSPRLNVIASKGRRLTGSSSFMVAMSTHLRSRSSNASSVRSAGSMNQRWPTPACA